MGLVVSKAGASRVTLEAKVIRADGTVEDLGTVAFWDRNPLVRLWWGVKLWLRKFKI